MVNNTRASSGWRYVLSSSASPGNKDPYMYVVTVSSLPKGTSYVIGDPRQDTYTNLSYSFSNTSWLYGSDHRLTYYYPTYKDDSDRSVSNMIAPSFRIASSYGVASTMSYSDAQKRCAAYQEDGYPAGRWRIPTKAEIEYMAKLAKDGKIPVLLSTDSYYWGSNGQAYKPDGTPSTSNSFIRCVYDEWYWKDKCTKTTFTWGDKER